MAAFDLGHGRLARRQPGVDDGAQGVDVGQGHARAAGRRPASTLRGTPRSTTARGAPSAQAAAARSRGRARGGRSPTPRRRRGAARRPASSGRTTANPAWAGAWAETSVSEAGLDLGQPLQQQPPDLAGPDHHDVAAGESAHRPRPTGRPPRPSRPCPAPGRSSAAPTGRSGRRCRTWPAAPGGARPRPRPTARARRTWPRICASPRTADSSPAATRNRWRSASSPAASRQARRGASGRAAASWPRAPRQQLGRPDGSPDTNSSTRKHVETRHAPSPASRAARYSRSASSGVERPRLADVDGAGRRRRARPRRWRARSSGVGGQRGRRTRRPRDRELNVVHELVHAAHECDLVRRPAGPRTAGSRPSTRSGRRGRTASRAGPRSDGRPRSFMSSA